MIAAMAFILAAWSGGNDAAYADLESKIEASYEVKVRGITVLDIEYVSEISDFGYRSNASIKTRGVATFFSDYRMKMATVGVLADDQSKPMKYWSHSEKNDKQKTVELKWSEGALWAQARHASKDSDIQAEIITAFRPGVSDPLTAIFRLGTSPAGNPCRAVHRIFDGKEVFELRFSFKDEALLDDGFPGVYHGKAYECRATYVPVAGRYATKFRKGNEDPPTYTVWLTSLGSWGTGQTRLVPVRATGRLDGIKFVAYASRITIDGRPFKSISSMGN